MKYRWISYLDDQLEKRVSDWENAVHCARCGKKIVHAYDPEKVNPATGQPWGEIGKECLSQEEGWNSEAVAKKARRKYAEEDYKARQAQHEVERIEKKSTQSTPHHAENDVRHRNGRFDSQGTWSDYTGPVTILHKKVPQSVEYGYADSDDRYFALPTGDLKIPSLLKAGWEEWREGKAEARSVIAPLLPLTEDTIDKETFNLHQMYRDLNGKWFDGKLPSIPVTWAKLRAEYGRAISSARNGQVIPGTSSDMKIVRTILEATRAWWETPSFKRFQAEANYRMVKDHGLLLRLIERASDYLISHPQLSQEMKTLFQNRDTEGWMERVQVRIREMES